MRKSSNIDYQYAKDKEFNEVGVIQEVYHNVVQELVSFAFTKNFVANAGRGIGKTTHIFARRLIDVSYALKGSVIILAAPTYSFIMDTLHQGISEYLNKYYIRGVHFEYGKRPPSHFIPPDADVARWQHTYSFVWGTVVQFVSADRPESAIGKNGTHVFCDETLRMPEVHFVERIMPALRSDRTKYEKSHFYGGITLTSSTPNLENDHDWWLAYKDNVNRRNIEEIQYTSYRIGIAAGKKVNLTVELEKLRHNGVSDTREIEKIERELFALNKFIRNWTEKRNQKLKEKENWWYFLHASSYSNYSFLGEDYMQQQMGTSGINSDKFNLSILAVRPKSVKNRFFAKFNANKHLFKLDSYKYTFSDGFRGGNIDTFSIGDGYTITSRDLAFCDQNKKLVAGYDPGGFSSIVFAQERKAGSETELNFIKNFWAYLPEEHHELALKIDTFFANHSRKIIDLYYDRAGNKRLTKYQGNPKGETDATILARELRDLGWTVNLKNLKQRTIYHWEHFLLFTRLFSEREKGIPRLRFCPHQCDELISSIQMTPLLPSDTGAIEMDKRAEKKLSFEDQVRYSPQIATAMTYLVWGLYSDLRPEKEKTNNYYEGL